jgi:hypothetical protein
LFFLTFTCGHNEPGDKVLKGVTADPREVWLMILTSLALAYSLQGLPMGLKVETASFSPIGQYSKEFFIPIGNAGGPNDIWCYFPVQIPFPVQVKINYRGVIPSGPAKGKEMPGILPKLFFFLNDGSGDKRIFEGSVHKKSWSHTQVYLSKKLSGIAKPSAEDKTPQWFARWRAYLKHDTGGPVASQGRMTIISPKAFIPVVDSAEAFKTKAEASAGAMLYAREPGRFVISPAIWHLLNIPGAAKVKIKKAPMKWELFDSGTKVGGGSCSSDRSLVIAAPEAMNHGLSLRVTLQHSLRPVEMRLVVKFFPNRAADEWGQYFRSP